MKKILAILLVLVLSLGLFTACGKDDSNNGDGANSGTKKIGFAQCNMNDTFQTYIVDAAKAKASEHGWKVDVTDAREDVVAQQDQVNSMIEQGYDAIIVVPVDTAAMEPITEAVTSAGIPLIYVNRNPYGTNDPPEGVYYVGSREVVAGELQAEFLIDKMGEKGGVAVLMGILSNEGALKRTEGVENILSKYPDVKVLAKETGEWQADKGMAITENWLTAYGKDLNAILANNDEMALGAVQALEAAGRSDVVVVGVDAIPSAKNMVAEGKMSATVLQDGVGQGAGAMDVINDIFSEKNPEPIKWVEFVLITPENVADYQ